MKNKSKRWTESEIGVIKGFSDLIPMTSDAKINNEIISHYTPQIEMIAKSLGRGYGGVRIKIDKYLLSKGHNIREWWTKK